MFGSIIKNLRIKDSMTQKELGNKIGVSDRTIGYYETEQRVPPQDVLQRLADYFNVTVDYLLGRDVKSSINPNVNNSEKTIDEELDELLDKLATNGTGLMFKGKALSETSKRALITSLKNAMALADQINSEESQKNG